MEYSKFRRVDEPGLLLTVFVKVDGQQLGQHNEQHARGHQLQSFQVDQQQSEQQGQEEGQRLILVLSALQKHEGQAEGHYNGKPLRRYLNNGLPAMEWCGNLGSVTAKSVTRIITPELYKAQQDAHRPFLLPEFQHTYQFMAGLEGLLSSRPVSLYAGGDNPFSPVTKSELSLWVTGSTIQGVCNMAITCRLALLEGESARLCTRRVRRYLVLSFNSHQQASQEARRLNAVVCGWQPAKQEARA